MSILNFVLKATVSAQKGTLIVKLKSLAILAVIGSPIAIIVDAISRWFSLNIEFVAFVFGAIMVDHVVGSYLHAYVKADFCLKKNVKGFFLKTTLVVLVFFLGQGLVNILGENHLIAAYFKVIMRLMVFIYPAGSALLNISTITGGKFPPTAFINKFSRFNKSMSLESLKEQKNE